MENKSGNNVSVHSLATLHRDAQEDLKLFRVLKALRSLRLISESYLKEQIKTFNFYHSADRNLCNSGNVLKLQKFDPKHISTASTNHRSIASFNQIIENKDNMDKGNEKFLRDITESISKYQAQISQTNQLTDSIASISNADQQNRRQNSWRPLSNIPHVQNTEIYQNVDPRIRVVADHQVKQEEDNSGGFNQNTATLCQNYYFPERLTNDQKEKSLAKSQRYHPYSNQQSTQLERRGYNNAQSSTSTNRNQIRNWNLETPETQQVHGYSSQIPYFQQTLGQRHRRPTSYSQKAQSYGHSRQILHSPKTQQSHEHSSQVTYSLQAPQDHGHSRQMTYSSQPQQSLGHSSQMHGYGHSSQMSYSPHLQQGQGYSSQMPSSPQLQQGQRHSSLIPYSPQQSQGYSSQVPYSLQPQQSQGRSSQMPYLQPQQSQRPSSQVPYSPQPQQGQGHSSQMLYYLPSQQGHGHSSQTPCSPQAQQDPGHASQMLFSPQAQQGREHSSQMPFSVQAQQGHGHSSKTPFPPQAQQGYGHSSQSPFSIHAQQGHAHSSQTSYSSKAQTSHGHSSQMSISPQGHGYSSQSPFSLHAQQGHAHSSQTPYSSKAQTGHGHSSQVSLSPQVHQGHGYSSQTPFSLHAQQGHALSSQTSYSPKAQTGHGHSSQMSHSLQEHQGHGYSSQSSFSLHAQQGHAHSSQTSYSPKATDHEHSSQMSHSPQAHQDHEHSSQIPHSQQTQQGYYDQQQGFRNTNLLNYNQISLPTRGVGHLNRQKQQYDINKYSSLANPNYINLSQTRTSNDNSPLYNLDRTQLNIRVNASQENKALRNLLMPKRTDHTNVQEVTGPLNIDKAHEHTYFIPENLKTEVYDSSDAYAAALNTQNYSTPNVTLSSANTYQNTCAVFKRPLPVDKPCNESSKLNYDSFSKAEKEIISKQLDSQRAQQSTRIEKRKIFHLKDGEGNDESQDVMEPRKYFKSELHHQSGDTSLGALSQIDSATMITNVEGQDFNIQRNVSLEMTNIDCQGLYNTEVQKVADDVYGSFVDNNDVQKVDSNVRLPVIKQDTINQSQDVMEPRKYFKSELPHQSGDTSFGSLSQTESATVITSVEGEDLTRQRNVSLEMTNIYCQGLYNTEVQKVADDVYGSFVDNNDVEKVDSNVQLPVIKQEAINDFLSNEQSEPISNVEDIFDVALEKDDAFSLSPRALNVINNLLNNLEDSNDSFSDIHLDPNQENETEDSLIDKLLDLEEEIKNKEALPDRKSKDDTQKTNIDDKESKKDKYETVLESAGFEETYNIEDVSCNEIVLTSNLVFKDHEGNYQITNAEEFLNDCDLDQTLETNMETESNEDIHVLGFIFRRSSTENVPRKAPKKRRPITPETTTATLDRSTAPLEAISPTLRSTGLDSLNFDLGNTFDLRPI